ncbi:MAG: HlyD family efflux transporter periplasmic adaptor subunit [Christensenellales bacterium]
MANWHPQADKDKGYFQGQPGFTPPGSQPADEDGDGFFTQAPGPAKPPRQAMPGPAMPPPYEGPLQAPPQYDPFSQFPQVPLGPGGAGSRVPAGSPPPPGQELPERTPYQAPPRRRSLMIWLYIGLGALVTVLGVMGVTQLLDNKQARTAIVQISEQGSTHAGSAIIVRDETVFMQEGVSDIRYIAQENAAVNRGDPVCTVYTTGFNSRELSQLQSYRKQIKEYLKILQGETAAPDTRLQLLTTTIFDRAVETRALVQGAHGNLLNQESLLKEAISSRYSYLKQKYPDDTKLTRLYDNENNQLQRIETWTKQYTASDNGIVSFYTDGFEGALNMANYLQYDPRQVDEMYRGVVPETFQRPKGSMDIYRLVRPYEWGVLMLADDLAWNPVVGENYQVMIESFDNTTVAGVVESVTRSGGDLLVRLTVNSPVGPVLNIRACHVQLSTSQITYAVPVSAIVNKDGQIGVVVQFREGPFIVPVVVVSQDQTQAYVVPVNPGHLYQGLTVQLY